MIVAKLCAEDMRGFEADARMLFSPPDRAAFWADMAAQDFSFVIKTSDGRVIGAAGYYQYDADDPRKAEMWALFSPDAGPFMVGVTRRTLATLDVARSYFDRIRAHVSCSFPQSIKWVLFLGFTRAGETVVNDFGAFDVYEWVG